MGLFSALSGMSVNMAYDILKKYRRGKCNSPEVIQALKILAKSNLLYKLNREDDYRLFLYYWEINGHLENIEGDSDNLPSPNDVGLSGVISLGNSHCKYVKVDSYECNNIDCRL